ncbi:MAG: TRAP transporter large permease subunit, partial [Desulfovibrio sp.]
MASSEQKDAAGASTKVNLARSAVEKELAGEASNDFGEVAGQQGFARLVQYLIFFGCLLFAGYHCVTTIFGMPVAYVHRPIHVMFAASLAFLVYPSSKKRGPAPLDLALALVALAAFALPAIQADQIAERLVMVDDLTLGQTISGITALVLVLVLIQRVVGMSLLVVCLLFLAYALWGNHIPGMLAHKGFSWNEVVDYLGFGLEGLYSSAIGVSATYIAAFIVFGTFLERCGAGDVLMDLGRALTGHYRGGPAKIAVITSAFFGTISGSAAANVYATGAFTIPMMKKAGYKPVFAGAVGAAAST